MFANIFANLIDARNSEIKSSYSQIESLEAQIQQIREFITRIEVEKAEVMESQQLVDSALQQLSKAVEVVSALAPEGLSILREQAISILDGDSPKPVIALLEAAIEPEAVEEVPTEPINPSDSEPTSEDATYIEAVEAKANAIAQEEIPTTKPSEIDPILEAPKEDYADKPPLPEVPTINEVIQMRRKSQVSRKLDELGIAHDKDSTLGLLKSTLKDFIKAQTKAA